MKYDDIKWSFHYKFEVKARLAITSIIERMKRIGVGELGWLAREFWWFENFVQNPVFNYTRDFWTFRK